MNYEYKMKIPNNLIINTIRILAYLGLKILQSYNISPIDTNYLGLSLNFLRKIFI